jgi:23S rRNA (cytosine1962-C5)-methyltransferase
MVLGLFILLALTTPNFLSQANLRNILDQQSLVLIAASAATITLISGGFDISQGAVYVAAPLVALGGYLVLCSCSHAADLARFRNASARGIGRAGRRGQILRTGFASPDHPTLPHLAESGYLKAVTFRLDG